MRLKSGQFYWMQQKREQVWRPAYVVQDPDGNQFLEVMGWGGGPMDVAKMKLDCFDWVAMTPPSAPNAIQDGVVADPEALFAQAAEFDVPKHVVEVFLDYGHDRLIVQASHWAHQAQRWQSKFEGEGRKTAAVIGDLLELCRISGLTLTDDLAERIAALDVRVRPRDLEGLASSDAKPG